METKHAGHTFQRFEWKHYEVNDIKWPKLSQKNRLSMQVML